MGRWHRLLVEPLDGRCLPAVGQGTVYPANVSVIADTSEPTFEFSGPVLRVPVAATVGRSAIVDWGDSVLTPGDIVPAADGLTADVWASRTLAIGRTYQITVTLSSVRATDRQFVRALSTEASGFLSGNNTLADGVEVVFTPPAPAAVPPPPALETPSGPPPVAGAEQPPAVPPPPPLPFQPSPPPPRGPVRPVSVTDSPFRAGELRAIEGLPPGAGAVRSAAVATSPTTPVNLTTATVGRVEAGGVGVPNAVPAWAVPVAWQDAEPADLHARMADRVIVVDVAAGVPVLPPATDGGVRLFPPVVVDAEYPPSEPPSAEVLLLQYACAPTPEAVFAARPPEEPPKERSWRGWAMHAAVLAVSAGTGFRLLAPRPDRGRSSGLLSRSVGQVF